MVISKNINENETEFTNDGTQYGYFVDKLSSYGFKVIENDHGWSYTIVCQITNELFLLSNIEEIRAFLSAVAHVSSKEYIREKFEKEHICELNVDMNDTCMVCGRKNIWNGR